MRKYIFTIKSVKGDNISILKKEKFFSKDKAIARMYEVYSSYYDNINVKRTECSDWSCEAYFDDGSIELLEVNTK